MGVITIQDLKPGMVTAAPVKTTAGQLIIGKNTVLTEALITRMSFYNIQNVSVVDIKDTVEEEPKKIIAPEHELSYSQKVRKSSSFQKFQIDYTRHITNFNNYLKELVNTRTMNHATELVEIPKLLISETRTSIQFFDMIHNLRQIDDPIFAHSLNVAMIAEAFNLNATYLSRYFKEETGENLLSYVNRYRIEQAKKLLDTTDETVTVIASQTGFINIASLIRTFKKYEGITPGQYKEKQLLKS